MIIHLFLFSYCLFYEKMIKYMSKYFFNIYNILAKKMQSEKNRVKIDLRRQTLCVDYYRF